MHISSLRQPGHPFSQDPWLCVTRLLWLCPFGERFKLVSANTSRALEKNYPHIKKRALSSSEDKSAPCIRNIPGAKMRISSLRQPGHPLVRIRGFASPDYSGFARSENVDSVCFESMWLFYQMPQRIATFFLTELNISDSSDGYNKLFTRNLDCVRQLERL